MAGGEKETKDCDLLAQKGEEEIAAPPLDEKHSASKSEKESMSQSSSSNSEGVDDCEIDLEKLDVDTPEKSNSTFRRSPSPNPNEILSKSRKTSPAPASGQKENSKKEVLFAAKKKKALNIKSEKRLSAVSSHKTEVKDRGCKVLDVIESIKSEV